MVYTYCVRTREKESPQLPALLALHPAVEDASHDAEEEQDAHELGQRA